MGCDIHAYLEYKIDGDWYLANVLNIGRDYELFGKMAGVRCQVDEIISEPKGIPENISFMTRFYYNDWKDDGHSYSWLDKHELAVLDNWLQEKDKKSNEYFCHPLKYVLENHFHEDVQDIRLVFWFDN